MNLNLKDMKKQNKNIRLNASYYSYGLDTWLGENLARISDENSAQKFHEMVLTERPKAEKGDAESQFRLGVAYALGKGVKKNYAEAFKWFQLSAKQGYDEALYNLGVCYEKGLGCKQDYGQAARYYQTAMGYGWHMNNARNNLACMYMEGRGVERNPEMAKKLWPKRPNGEIYTNYNVATMYANGDGVKANIKKAIKYYLYAIRYDYLSHDNARYMLAFLYHYGIGVPQNYKRAAMFYRELAGQGHEAAAFKLSLIENKIPPYDTLRFEIRKQEWALGFSYGIRVFVNDFDLFTIKHIGFEPKRPSYVKKLFRPGQLLIGICGCSSLGCNDYHVNVIINQDTVTWEDWKTKQTYIFRRPEYEKAVERLRIKSIRYIERHKHK